jgi:hypothetical protein
MIECVNGNGQGCCAICLHIIGWHRKWSSGLYYVRNKHGLYLRRNDGYGDVFSTDNDLPKATFCHEHAKQVEEQRMHQTDWELETDNAPKFKKPVAKLRKLTPDELHDYIDRTERKFDCICTACESLCFSTDTYCANCGAELEDE